MHIGAAYSKHHHETRRAGLISASPVFVLMNFNIILTLDYLILELISIIIYKVYVISSRSTLSCDPALDNE
jgi:hypothetical protein